MIGETIYNFCDNNDVEGLLRAFPSAIEASGTLRTAALYHYPSKKLVASYLAGTTVKVKDLLTGATIASWTGDNASCKVGHPVLYGNFAYVPFAYADASNYYRKIKKVDLVSETDSEIYNDTGSSGSGAASARAACGCGVGQYGLFNFVSPSVTAVTEGRRVVHVDFDTDTCTSKYNAENQAGTPSSVSGTVWHDSTKFYYTITMGAGADEVYECLLAGGANGSSYTTTLTGDKIYFGSGDGLHATQSGGNMYWANADESKKWAAFSVLGGNGTMKGYFLTDAAPYVLWLGDYYTNNAIVALESADTSVSTLDTWTSAANVQGAKPNGIFMPMFGSADRKEIVHHGYTSAYYYLIPERDID